MMNRKFYCKGDMKYHEASELPKSLRPFVNHKWSSGGEVGKDFVSFNTKFKNAIRQMLPRGWQLHKWISGHYYCSAVLKNPDGDFVYISIPDVRYFPHEWFTSILYRSMKHETDWSGGSNHYTSLFSLAKDVDSLIA